MNIFNKVFGKVFKLVFVFKLLRFYYSEFWLRDFQSF